MSRTQRIRRLSAAETLHPFLRGLRHISLRLLPRLPQKRKPRENRVAWPPKTRAPGAQNMARRPALRRIVRGTTVCDTKKNPAEKAASLASERLENRFQHRDRFRQLGFGHDERRNESEDSVARTREEKP